VCFTMNLHSHILNEFVASPPCPFLEFHDNNQRPGHSACTCHIVANYAEFVSVTHDTSRRLPCAKVSTQLQNFGLAQQPSYWITNLKVVSLVSALRINLVTFEYDPHVFRYGWETWCEEWRHLAKPLRSPQKDTQLTLFKERFVLRL
jgi:hypothetical protein